MAIIAMTTCHVHADVPVDKITVLNLPPATPYRLYLSDWQFPTLSTTSKLIIDGESLNVIGHVALGMTGHATLTPDHSDTGIDCLYDQAES